MENCLLCQQHAAIKTGSHIIPSFLMKRVNGDGRRDHEIGFIIKNAIVDTYFGRNIYEDKRKAITDNEEKFYSRENYDVKDYIFCKECEDYLGILERKYADSLSLKFTENKTTKNTKVSPSEALLFWCSLVWRASVTSHLGSRLNPDLEERLRQALNSNNIENLNVKYALFRCKDFSKISGHGTVVCMDVKDNNVLLLVDEFMLIMVFDMPEKHETVLFGISLQLKIESLNDGKKEEEISPIPSDIFLQLVFSVITVMVAHMNLPEKFNLLFKRVFGEEMPHEIFNEIIELLFNSGKLGDKYTPEHYAWCFKEVLIKHGLIKDNGDNTYSVVKN